MKKIFLSIFVIFCIGTLAVNATDTNSITSTTTKPNSERIGHPYQDGNFENRTDPPKGAPKDGQKPRKKPDSKPGGDRVPPEFMQNHSNSSESTATSK